jgi:glycosyltransferase involved in cell wall biosynthesis
MNSPIDIFICTYLRQYQTEQTLTYLEERTKYPYRLFIINNGGSDEVLDAYKEKIFLRVDVTPNSGIHNAWNLALAMAESEYFVTSDNDIYVPDLEPDWLSQMVKMMDERPDYGAISLCPHVFIGAAGIDPNDPEDVKERNMCGAVMRIMRKKAVWEAGGWENVIRTGRNHEERTICGRLQEKGWKTGITTRLRAYHPFGRGRGGNWGYPKEFTPEMQGHNPDLEEYVQQFDNINSYDNKTWMPKI